LLGASRFEPTPKRRAVAAFGIALVAVALQAHISQLPGLTTDLDPIRLGADLLLHGSDPYTIGPGRAHYWAFPLLYPLPAVLLAIPLVALPQFWARIVFVALSSGTVSYILTRRAWWPLVACASASFLYTVVDVQWAPLLLASWYVPVLGFTIAAKPNVGLAVLAAARSRRAFVVAGAGAAVLVIVAVAVRPTWPVGWWSGATEQHHILPFVVSWLGAPLLLAGVRWRRPEARLLLVLAVLPQNPSIYDALVLFAVPATIREALILATLSWFVEPIRDALHPTAEPASMAHATQIGLLAVMYLPALVMVLRRPNEDEAH
jgi:hypothetical protein